jgi:Big-like domain-containing protein
VFQLARRGGSLAKGFVCLAIFVGVTITVTPQEAAAQGNRPTVSVTSPADGSTYPAGATVPFSATASDRDGIARIELYVDSVLYATSYSDSATISLTNVAPGSYTLTAVAWDGRGISSTSPGVTLIISSPSGGGNQPPSLSVTSPAIGAIYSVGATIPFSVTASDPDGTITWVGFYVDSVLRSSTTSSPYSTSLSNLSTGVHKLTAIAWDNAGSWTTSADITVTVGSSTVVSQPSVAITSPTNGASYPAGATIPVSATASDADGTITWVGFYVDSVLQSYVTSSPYSTSLANVATGSHTLTAIAWDNTGTWTTSAPITVTVGSSGTLSNQPPAVSLTAPAAGATFTAPASITLSATASDVDGTIARVDFYANGTLVGTDTSSPYSFSWTNVAAANYALTAVARDNAGATTVSSTRDISVKPASLPSSAVFTPSSNDATAVDRYVLEVFPVGADPTVANPVATRDLGKPAITNGECRVDISSTILALSPGTYIATVTAIGSGGSTQSAPSPQFTR